MCTEAPESINKCLYSGFVPEGAICFCPTGCLHCQAPTKEQNVSLDSFWSLRNILRQFSDVFSGAPLLSKGFILRPFLEIGSPRNSLLKLAFLNNSPPWTLHFHNFYVTHRGLCDLDSVSRVRSHFDSNLYQFFLNSLGTARWRWVTLALQWQSALLVVPWCTSATTSWHLSSCSGSLAKTSSVVPMQLRRLGSFKNPSGTSLTGRLIHSEQRGWHATRPSMYGHPIMHKTSIHEIWKNFFIWSSRRATWRSDFSNIERQKPHNPKPKLEWEMRNPDSDDCLWDVLQLLRRVHKQS